MNRLLLEDDGYCRLVLSFLFWRAHVVLLRRLIHGGNTSTQSCAAALVMVVQLEHTLLGLSSSIVRLTLCSLLLADPRCSRPRFETRMLYSVLQLYSWI